MRLENQQRLFFNSFLAWSRERVASADKMMIHAKGPVWHKKQKEKNIIPKGLTGIDKEATWSYSKASHWVYGHGTFSLVSHRTPVLGCFIWMRNSAHEAKRMWMETGRYTGTLKTLVMDSKADDYALFREFKRQRKITLVTKCRKNSDHTPERRQMIRTMKRKENKQYYKERSITVEPMQGLAKDIFDLDRCWMRGNKNNRWLFAAMGLTVQMHQLQAYRNKQSTWSIKSEVLGHG